MGEPEVLEFLNWLVVDRRVAHSTQMQALGALLFLDREVLRTPLGDLRGLIRARGPVRLPVVLTAEEVGAILAQLRGSVWLVGALLSGSGLRLSEALGLRVKDLDWSRREIVVRRGKGGKDRVPDALERKTPSAARGWAWQWVFPAMRRYIDTATGERRRWHMHPSLVQRAVAEAVAVTPSGTPSRPLFWRGATTFGRCRSCSGIRASAPRWSTSCAQPRG